VAVIYFSVIRVIELDGINDLATDRKLQRVFLWFFLPTFLLLTVVGFVAFFRAGSSKCVSLNTY
jgi:hypothetical protein